jgi:hypothetical protein
MWKFTRYEGQMPSEGKSSHVLWPGELKIVNITKNRNFFNCLLLPYYKSIWSRILTLGTQQWVVLTYFSIFSVTLFSARLYQIFILWEKTITLKSSDQKFELRWSLIGPLSKLYATHPPSILHPRWLALLLEEINGQFAIFSFYILLQYICL